jgi:hypothetical protein
MEKLVEFMTFAADLAVRKIKVIAKFQYFLSLCLLPDLLQ